MMLFYVLLVFSGVAIGFLLCYMMVGVKELRRKAELYDASGGERKP
ncbi:MAG: hypothetical protein ACT4PK_07710 [Gammaproteobacteria bacterium]